jgi:hypothetical protein
MQPAPERDWEAETAATELVEALDALCWLVAGNTQQMDGTFPANIHSLFCVLRRTAEIAAKPYR